MRVWQALTLALCGCGITTAATAPSLDVLANEIRLGVNALESMEFMRRIYSTDRWFTFPKFAETANYVADTMRQIGLRDVEILNAPADGQTQVGFWTMPMAWDIRQGALEIVSPVLPAESRLLADYRTVPTSVGMWSGPTPPKGVTGEIVELEDPSVEKIHKLDLRGKFVLTARDLREFKWMLVDTGALGTISAFTENPALRDGREWINSWGDYGWAFTRKSTPLLSFSITPRQLELLQNLLVKGPVKVRATVQSRYYEGSYPIVTGVIRGSMGGQEVLTLGHSFEQGAQDNATGVAAMLEAMATLNRLIESGRLPRPRRTIRMLTTAEIYGSLSYILKHPGRMRQTVAAICIDTPASSYDMAGSEYTFYMNPQVAASYVDALILKIAATYFAKVRRPWHSHPAAAGGDNYLSDPMIGIPTIWVYSSSWSITHHNSEDTPERVDARSMRDLSAVNAMFLYYIAAAGESEALWMAELALTRGYEEILAALAPFIERVGAASDTAELSTILRDGLEQIEYSVGRGKQAVTSATRLLQTTSGFKQIAERLDRFGAEQSSRLLDAVNRRAEELGLPVPIRPANRPFDLKLATSSELVVQRKRIGTLPLDDLSPAEREGYPSGAWNIIPITALYWCDGHRSLAEVARLTRLEWGSLNFDVEGYFRFLARHGYVNLNKPARQKMGSPR